MKYLFFIGLIMLSVFSKAHAQDLIGKWNGKLETQGVSLRIVFHVSQLDDGTFKTLMDSPDQNALDLPMDETLVNGDTIQIKAGAMGIHFKGTYDAMADDIKGVFKQGLASIELNLTRDSVASAVKTKPQEPQEMNYIQEELNIINGNGGHTLAGTFTRPSNKEFNKIAILVSGSGPQNRDEELLGHKPFLVLSDYLTRNGIAVYRYDDRGVGKSTGDFATATSEDFAQDVEAIVAYFRSSESYKDKMLGIVGHSEGGMIAPIVASRTEVDFIVLLAGPGTKIDHLLERQALLIAQAQEMDPKDIETNSEVSRSIFEYMKQNNHLPTDAFNDGLKKILESEINKLPAEMIEEAGGIEALTNTQFAALSTPWFRYFVDFNPADFVSKVKCPVLAINGASDLQVPAEENLLAIAQYLTNGGNTNFTIKKLNDLNHLFQTDPTGNPDNYAEIDETFNEQALELISDWILKFDQLN